jgi:hypothetical protein
MSKQVDQTDRDLSLKAATRIDAGTTSIKGREKRDMGRENEARLTTENEKARKAHPSIAGNVTSTCNATWAGGALKKACRARCVTSESMRIPNRISSAPLLPKIWAMRAPVQVAPR